MLFGDLALALRGFRKNPAFALAAGLMIAVGIGSVTLMFAVLNSVILRPLPYKDPDRLVVAYGDMRARSRFGSPLSYENFVDISESTKTVFSGISGFYTGRMVLLGPDDTWEQISFGAAVPNLFRTLGVSLVLGRDFEESDLLPEPGGETQTVVRKHHAVILSHEFWRRRYGSDVGILDRSLDGRPASRERVVGVLAPRFELLFSPADQVELRPDAWFAYRPRYNNANRNGMTLRTIAKLRPEASVEQAGSVVELAVSRIRQEFSNYSAGDFHVRLEPMPKALVSEVRPTVLALMGSVVFLLLIACANVLNLLLVRSSLRAREMAVRSALGAGVWPLVRLSLAEALILVAGGAVAGLFFAHAGLRQLLSIAPANLPRIEAAGLDPIVLAVTAGIALAVAAVFGLAPVVGCLRANVSQVLRGNSRTAGLSGGGALRDSVVVLEVALCFALLIGSALMMRSFVALQKIDPGFDPNGLLTFELMGKPDGSSGKRATQARQIEERLRAIPGVRSVGASRLLPLGGGFTSIRWGVEEALTDPTKLQNADWQVVRPGYFETMRTEVIDGRSFTEADNDRNFVVVDDYLAAKVAPTGGSAVGKRILTRIRTPELEWVEIAGVVKHQRSGSLAQPGREQIYFIDGFLGFGSANRWSLRTTGDPMRLAGPARAAIKSVDPKLLFTEVQSMETLMHQAKAGTRFVLILIGTFTSIAILLVAVGLYGLLATIVRQRTPEIGVRMALGAPPLSIQRMIVVYALRLSTAGVIIGILTAVGFARFMTAMLIGIEPTDPATFAVAAMLFVVIAAASSWLPARRAAAIDPVVALQGE